VDKFLHQMSLLELKQTFLEELQNFDKIERELMQLPVTSMSSDDVERLYGEFTNRRCLIDHIQELVDSKEADG
jgi:hypothetical protein